MKITAIETYWTQTPFDMGGKPKALGGLNWQNMNTVWLRVGTDAGLRFFCKDWSRRFPAGF